MKDVAETFVTCVTFFVQNFRTKMRRKKFVPISKAESEEEEPEERINTRELTLDEIEEIRLDYFSTRQNGLAYRYTYRYYKAKF